MKFLTHDGISYFWGKIKSYIDTKYNELFQSVSNGKKSVANAITGKGVATNATDTFATMATNIGKITTGVETNDATAVAGEILSGKTAYVKGSKVTGTMANRTFSVESAYTRADKLLADGTGALCVAPPPGYYDDAVNNYGFGKIICIDDNYNGSNIRKGVSIFGVQGTYEGLSPNGSTKSYYAYAGQNIQAGDFIKYLTGVAGLGTGNFTLRQGLNGDTIVYDVVALDSERMAIIYGVVGGNLYVVIGKLNGVDMEYGTAYNLNYSNTKYAKLTICNGYVVSAYATSSGGSIGIRIFSVDGFVLTSIANTIVQTTSNGNYIECLFSTSNNNFMVVNNSSANNYIVVDYFSFSSGTITKLGNGYSLYNNSSSPSNWGVAVSPDKKKLHFAYYNGSTLTATRFIISPTNITYESSYGYTGSLAVGYSNKTYIISPDTNMVGWLKDFNGTVKLVVANYTGTYIGSVDITPSNSVMLEFITFTPTSIAGKFLLCYSNYNDSSLILRARIVTINNNSLSVSEERTLSATGINKGYYGCGANLIGQKVVVFASPASGRSHYTILNIPGNTIDTYNYIYETQIAKANNNNEIQGVAHSNATGGTLSGANAGHNQATNVTSITSP